MHGFACRDASKASHITSCEQRSPRGIIIPDRTNLLGQELKLICGFLAALVRLPCLGLLGPYDKHPNNSVSLLVFCIRRISSRLATRTAFQPHRLAQKAKGHSQPQTGTRDTKNQTQVGVLGFSLEVLRSINAEVFVCNYVRVLQASAMRGFWGSDLGANNL